MKLKKSTEELYSILENKNNIENYIYENDNEFIDMTLSQYLEYILQKYDLSKKEVINKSLLSQIYAYQIFSGKKNNPSRDKILQLIFPMNIDLKDAQRLLHIAGVSKLYPRNRRDSVIIFALKKGKTLEECDEILFELGENTIMHD